jgi:hypothetical protein
MRAFTARMLACMVGVNGRDPYLPSRLAIGRHVLRFEILVRVGGAPSRFGPLATRRPPGSVACQRRLRTAAALGLRSGSIGVGAGRETGAYGRVATLTLGWGERRSDRRGCEDFKPPSGGGPGLTRGSGPRSSSGDYGPLANGAAAGGSSYERLDVPITAAGRDDYQGNESLEAEHRAHSGAVFEVARLGARNADG